MPKNPEIKISDRALGLTSLAVLGGVGVAAALAINPYGPVHIAGEYPKPYTQEEMVTTVSDRYRVARAGASDVEGFAMQYQVPYETRVAFSDEGTGLFGWFGKSQKGIAVVGQDCFSGKGYAVVAERTTGKLTGLPTQLESASGRYFASANSTTVTVGGDGTEALKFEYSDKAFVPANADTVATLEAYGCAETEPGQVPLTVYEWNGIEQDPSGKAIISTAIPVR